MAVPTFRPSSEAELVELIAGAAASGERLSIAGGDSKAAIGRACSAAKVEMTAFCDVIDYDHAELVLTAGAGAALTDIEALVSARDQMLAFEPFDHGPIFGMAAGKATIGGVIAAGVAGSQRLACGGVRDHLLGFRAVSGRGEAFVAGAKVVKNVTGYDLPKLAAGSWGRLFALTEVTLKVLPRPRTQTTLIIDDLDSAGAVAAMAEAMRSPAEIAAAAHFPATDARGASTLLRIQGFGPSVAARSRMLATLLAPYGRVRDTNLSEANAWWQKLRVLEDLPRTAPLWRINLSPSRANGFIQALALPGADWVMDWAGGLIWLAFAGDAETLRDGAAQHGGHAVLVRAGVDARAVIPALHPPAPAIAALETRVRRAFDPAGVFETGRF